MRLYFLDLEVRRLDAQQQKQQAGATTKSAEADHRKQAMIAAAEARDKQHKAKSKPVKHMTKSTQARLEAANKNNGDDTDDTPKTEAARQAAAAAKQGEAALAAQLGYNPYETAKATAGQARTGVTATQHGAIEAGAATPSALPPVSPPRDPTASIDDVELPIEFEEAYATAISSTDSSAVKSSFGIMQKLVINATNKGQASSSDGDTDTSAKFRKVRLANAKIKAALVDLPGGVELMLAFGFVLEEVDGESVLQYPPNYKGPSWLSSALRQLESYQV